MVGLFQWLAMVTATNGGIWMLSAVMGRSSMLWGFLLIAASWVFMVIQGNQIKKKALESFTNAQRFDAK
jgi:hypothetical protein